MCLYRLTYQHSSKLSNNLILKNWFYVYSSSHSLRRLILSGCSSNNVDIVSHIFKYNLSFSLYNFPVLLHNIPIKHSLTENNSIQFMTLGYLQLHHSPSPETLPYLRHHSQCVLFLSVDHFFLVSDCCPATSSYIVPGIHRNLSSLGKSLEILLFRNTFFSPREPYS